MKGQEIQFWQTSRIQCLIGTLWRRTLMNYLRAIGVKFFHPLLRGGVISHQMNKHEWVTWTTFSVACMHLLAVLLQWDEANSETSLSCCTSWALWMKGSRYSWLLALDMCACLSVVPWVVVMLVNYNQDSISSLIHIV